MTDITSETLKRLLEKATPGPWHSDMNGLSGYGDNGNTFNVMSGDESHGGVLIASLPSSFRLLDRDDLTDADVQEEKATSELLAISRYLAQEVLNLREDIARVRVETLEEAAKVADGVQDAMKEECDFGAGVAARAIRSLKDATP